MKEVAAVAAVVVVEEFVELMELLKQAELDIEEVCLHPFDLESL